LRTKFTTSLDDELLTKLRLLAVNSKLDINDILEDLVRQLFDGKVMLSKHKK
jgi:hypothetical protein